VLEDDDQALEDLRRVLQLADAFCEFLDDPERRDAARRVLPPAGEATDPAFVEMRTASIELQERLERLFFDSAALRGLSRKYLAFQEGMIGMGSVLFDETAIERTTAEAVRREVEQRIDKGEWTVSFLAERLGLVTAGVDAVMRRHWTFEEAFRIATAVGIDFSGKLDELGGSASET
jgi:hypothetical protein